MRTIHIRVRHNDNFIVAELRNIKIISISFRKPAAKSVDHCLDLCIGKHLIDRRLFNIEDFSTDGKNRLIIPVSRSLGRAACGISSTIKISH